jgi:hypothetical protein
MTMRRTAYGRPMSLKPAPQPVQPMTAYGQPMHRIQPAAGGYHVVQPNGQKSFVSTHPGSAAAAHAPAGPPGAPLPGTDPEQTPSPLDAQYYAESAKNLFGVNQGVAQSDMQGQQRQATLEEALRRLGQQQPKDELATTEAANRQGLFYSGQLGQRLGDLASRYSRQRSDLNANYANQEAARLAARAALQQGYTVDDAALQAAAVGRQIQSDQAAADVGGLVAPAGAVSPGQVRTATGEAAPAAVVSGSHVRAGTPAVVAPRRRRPRMTAFGRPM